MRQGVLNLVIRNLKGSLNYSHFIQESGEVCKTSPGSPPLPQKNVRLKDLRVFCCCCCFLPQNTCFLVGAHKRKRIFMGAIVIPGLIPSLSPPPRRSGTLLSLHSDHIRKAEISLFSWSFNS